MTQILIVLLLMTLGAQVFLRSFLVRYMKTLFWAITVLVLGGNAIWVTYAQYDAWKHNGITQYLLPPHQGVGYFIHYSFFRIWASWVVALGFALIFVWAAKWYNEKHNKQFFEEEEYWIGAFSILVIAWPGTLIYMVTFLVVFLINSLIMHIIKGKQYKTSPYYLWIPVSIFAILVSELILKGSALWSVLKL